MTTSCWDRSRRVAAASVLTAIAVLAGAVLLALGVAVVSASVWVVLAVAAYFLAFFPSVMREETDFLAKKFPEDFAEWSAEVPPFLPRLTPGGPRSSHFELSRVTVNREWRTVAALPLVAFVLYARTLLGL